ncbi:MAG: TatD family hydrolase [Patescibacteria group bacterium]
MYLIDTHCHISHLKRGQKAVIDRAFKAGVKKFVNVACKIDEFQPSLDLAKKYDCIWSTAGIHPTMLTDDMEKGLAAVRGLAAGEKKVVAIGEIGLDYYHDKFPHDRQEDFFTAQLGIAKELGLPAIIHLRSSKNPGGNEAVFVDALRILEREDFSNGVAHCFSGNMIEAEKLLDLGLMISFTGIITYESNEALREVVKMMPLDRMMLETDSPYLTVENRKGQAGEPADVKVIAKTVARVKNVPFEEVANITTANAERFFGI